MDDKISCFFCLYSLDVRNSLMVSSSRIRSLADSGDCFAAAAAVVVVFLSLGVGEGDSNGGFAIPPMAFVGDSIVSQLSSFRANDGRVLPRHSLAGVEFFGDI